MLRCWGHRDRLLVTRQYTTRKCCYEMLTRSVCPLGFVQVTILSIEGCTGGVAGPAHARGPSIESPLFRVQPVSICAPAIQPSMGPLVKGNASSSVMNVLCPVENDRRAQGVGLERTHHEETLAIACNREVVEVGP